LKKEKIGRATFLPLNKIKPILFKDNELLKESGVINVVSKIIKYETKFMSAIEFVFGNTLIVKDLDSARSLGIGKARMVTLEGDLIERSGAMIGGHYIRKHPKAIESSKKEEIDRYLNLKKELEKEIQSLKAELETLQNRLKELGSSEATKEMIDLEKVRISSEKEIDELREKRKSLYEKKLSLQEKLNKFEIRKAKLEGELESLRIDVKQYGEIEYIDERVSTLKKHIQNASEELASIGLVNLKAIEEYDRSKTEFDEYKKKYEKILEEKKAVLQMIEEIEEKRREVFNKCLEEVSRYFSNVFLKMCGGSASLELENPLDMESGLRIQANPEGKKLLSIDSMSGGEKTLTALAFIFAIQKYKPAPFYILDEIDAALDKKNSKIVAELIGELSRKAQFIIITHNDQTIKYGDRVYGATMSQGETKILGLEMPA
jgi:chromosome segregation protein